MQLQVTLKWLLTTLTLANKRILLHVFSLLHEGTTAAASEKSYEIFSLILMVVNYSVHYFSYGGWHSKCRYNKTGIVTLACIGDYIDQMTLDVHTFI